MFSAKWLLLALGVITIFSFVTGVVAYEKRSYACFPADFDKYRFGEKVEVFNVGNFHFYVSPLTKGCDEEYRYDPSKIEECGVYCRRGGL